MLLESLYRLIEEQVDRYLHTKNIESKIDSLYKFVSDEVKRGLHLTISKVYAYQFDILPKHQKLQNPLLNPFYIVVNDDGSGSMFDKSGEEVCSYNPLAGDDAFAAIAVYRNCLMYKITMISPTLVPKKK